MPGYRGGWFGEISLHIESIREDIKLVQQKSDFSLATHNLIITVNK